MPYRKVHTHLSHILISYVLALSILLTGCHSTPATNSTEHATDSNALRQTVAMPFLDYTSLLFKEQLSSDTISLHYTLSDPAAFGIDKYNICLPDYSTQTMEQNQLFLENTASCLSTYPYDSLSLEERVTYDVLQDYVNHAALSGDFPYYEEILRPSTGLSAQLPILLAEYHFYSKQDIEDYLSLLALLPECFQNICEYETAKAKAGLFMPDFQVDTLLADIASICNTSKEHYLITTFKKRLEELNASSDTPALTAEEMDAYIHSNQQLFTECFLTAYQNLSDYLASQKGSGKNDAGLCYLENGLSYYEQLVYDSTASEHSIDELLDMTSSQRMKDMIAMASIQEENPSVSLTITDFPLTDAAPEAMLSYLSTAIVKDFPALASADYAVCEVDACMQSSSAPAFYLTAPIDNLSHNIIYINPASAYDDLKLFTTLAHEGYPGHLYQNTKTAEESLPPLRAILNYPGYIEGWATYVELLSYSYAGLPNEQSNLLMHNQSALLSLYATADLSIHGKGWTQADLIDFFGDFGITDKNAILNVYQYIVAEPAHYLKYYIGYLEFLALKDYAKELCGDSYTDSSFHEAVLRIGPAPFAIVKKYLPEYMKH